MDVMGKCRAMVLLFAIVSFTGGEVRGQALEWPFFDRVASFTNRQGEAVPNATLIRADATQIIYKTNDIYGTVKLTNLSPATLDYIGVPASFLEQVMAQKQKQAQAAAKTAALWKSEQEKLRDPASLIPVTVESVISADYDSLHGKLQRCNVRMTNGAPATLWVARLPDAVPAYLQKEQALAQDISRLTQLIQTGAAQVEAGAANLQAGAARVDQVEQQVGQNIMLTPAVVYDGMFANPGFDVFSVNAARRNLASASNEVANAQNQVNEWRDNRDALQGQLNQMKNSEPMALTVMVLVSHFPHYGGQVLVCAPPPPEQTGQ
jgi:hypothetical protein